ncbi:MAG TPA: hypothetical protein VG733_14155 [Chthoniobacteraceae bacterium]|nr:hypothetical protein [Chthoniobacteraceae bacterium]
MKSDGYNLNLQPETYATLKQLQEAEWFDCVGRFLIIEDEPVEVVTSWEEAMECCTSQEWDWALLESGNIFRGKIRTVSMDELRTWNARVEKVRPLAMSLVNEKTRLTKEQFDLPDVFESNTYAQILMVLMEAEYSQIVAPGNFSKLELLFLNGHFPCGWRGEFPDGELIIY